MAFQSVHGGLTVDVPVTSDDPNVGTITAFDPIRSRNGRTYHRRPVRIQRARQFAIDYRNGELSVQTPVLRADGGTALLVRPNSALFVKPNRSQVLLTVGFERDRIRGLDPALLDDRFLRLEREPVGNFLG
jgi:hypothetical protein